MSKYVFAVLFLILSARGFTISVQPGDNIADSLSSLSEGDTLFLMPGIYTSAGQLPLLTVEQWQSGVTVTSSPLNRAVLDGNNHERSVIRLNGPHQTDVVLENLVIKGGNATGAEAFSGGGIACSESSALVNNCLITENTALIGGGIAAEGGFLKVQYSTLSNNEALVTGGGIDLYACDFTGFLLKFTGNTSSDDGGGLNSYQSNMNLCSSVFTENYSGDDGGAITVLQGTSHLSFLTIHSNEAFDDGGGIRIHTVDSLSLESSIITSNSGKAGINVISENIPFISHVCCWNNSFSNYHGMEDPTGIQGNISTNPLYADGEFNLSQISAGQAQNSPGLNKGHISAQEADVAELSTRTDSLSDTGIADMGFHHLNPQQTGIEPGNPVGQQHVISVSPSPLALSSGRGLSINISPPVNTPTAVTGFDMFGRQIFNTTSSSFVWYPDREFPGGLVLLQAVWSGGSATGKAMVLR